MDGIEQAREEPDAISNDGDGDVDERLDRTALGEEGTSDETASGTGEIDQIGDAAGLLQRDDKPFRGIDEVERRDVHRWEVDPESADDGCDRGTD